MFGQTDCFVLFVCPHSFAVFILLLSLSETCSPSFFACLNTDIFVVTHKKGQKDYTFLEKSCTFAPAYQKRSCRSGGMVDTRDLKSLGHCAHTGSSPVSGTYEETAARIFLAAVSFSMRLIFCQQVQRKPLASECQHFSTRM